MARDQTQPNRPLFLAWLLRLVCAAMFVGHGLMCWNGQMPLRALLWDEALVSGAVQRLAGMDWDTWVSSMEVDAGINRAIRAQAWIFFFFAVAVLLPVRKRAVGLLYIAAAVNLLFLSWLKYHDVGMGVGQLLEHASQFCLPLVLALFFWQRGNAWEPLAKLSLATTFVAHGVYAVGLPAEVPWLNHQRPGKFTEMTMLCLELESESIAGWLLLSAGLLDFLVAAMIFLPGWPRRVGLSYMVVWGFLTALARPWAYFEPTAASETLIRWVPEMLYRAPHFGLPLCLLLALRWRQADS
ncbi:MAG: hypothetical protein ACR2RV_07425 [Verrucomicrobiales bacterium]